MQCQQRWSLRTVQHLDFDLLSYLLLSTDFLLLSFIDLLIHDFHWFRLLLSPQRVLTLQR